VAVVEIGPTFELPELDTPLVDLTTPTEPPCEVLLEFPPVADAPELDVAPDVEDDVAPLVLLELLVEVEGVVGGVVGGSASQINVRPESTTT
jgi:hypothetical protein